MLAVLVTAAMLRAVVDELARHRVAADQLLDQIVRSPSRRLGRNPDAASYQQAD
jgi:hypothetical protein